MQVPLSRRRATHWIALVATGVCAPHLTACASDGLGIRSYSIGQAQLAELVAKRFPHTRSFSGLAELQLRSPRLRLIPEQNRLGTLIDVVVTENLTGSRSQGSIDLDYGLRFDAQRGAVVMSDARVNRVDFDRIPPLYRQPFAQNAPRVAEQLLANLELYRIPPEQLELARGIGFVVNALRVTPEGLKVELAPRGLQ